MRSKLMLAMGLLTAVVLFAAMTPVVSAHDWRSGYGYYGMGRHDFVPHWHSYVTPYGSYSYYGLGAHDFVPHAHYYGGYDSRYGLGYPYYNRVPYYSQPYYSNWPYSYGGGSCYYGD